MHLVWDRLVSLMSVSVVGFGLLFFYTFSSSGDGADVLDGEAMVLCHFEVDEPQVERAHILVRLIFHPKISLIINVVFQIVESPIDQPSNEEAMSRHHSIQIIDRLDILNQIVNLTRRKSRVKQDLLEGGIGLDETLQPLHLRLIDFEVANDHFSPIQDICTFPTGGERIKEKEAKTHHRNAH